MYSRKWGGRGEEKNLRAERGQLHSYSRRVSESFILGMGFKNFFQPIAVMGKKGKSCQKKVRKEGKNKARFFPVPEKKKVVEIKRGSRVIFFFLLHFCGGRRDEGGNREGKRRDTGNTIS